MTENEPKKRKPEETEEDPFEIPEVDDAPAPQEFQRPKWLMNLKPQEARPESPEVKSGAAHGTPPPLAGGSAGPPARPYAPPKVPAKPKGASVAQDRPAPRKDAPPIVPPDASKADVRIERPQAGNTEALKRLADVAAKAEVRVEKPKAGSTEALKRLSEEASEADVKVDKPAAQAPDLETLRRLSDSSFEVQAGAPRRPAPALRPLEEGPVEIKKAGADHHEAPPIPGPPQEFDVVVDATAKNPLSQHLKVTKPRKVLGIVDTTFARYNMGEAAADEIRRLGGQVDVVRRTVPGIKDLAVECKILFEEEDCDLVIACGMVGGQPIDKQCAHEASLAIQWAMLQTNRHILEVFVHADEAQDEKQLAWLMDRRTREHALNAVWLLIEPQKLREQAGRGLRQGFDDEGPIKPE